MSDRGSTREPPTWTGFGVVGLGDPGEPSRRRTRPDLCADHGHPGCTYNDRMDRTWCLCGEVVTEGDAAVPHVSCCGGPLEEVIERPAEATKPVARRDLSTPNRYAEGASNEARPAGNGALTNGLQRSHDG